MKRARLLILVAISFGIGALFATGGRKNVLRVALRSAGAIPMHDDAGQTEAKGVQEQTVQEQTVQERFGQLLSAMQERSRLKQRHDLFEAIGDLSAAEVAALIERVPRFPSDVHHTLTTALLERWLDLDQESAARWVRARPRELQWWTIWAAKCPENAIAEVHLRRDANFRGEWVLQSAIATLAGPEKKDQAARLAQLPADAARDVLLTRTVGEWAKTDAAGAFAFTRTLPAGEFRTSLSESALRELANADPQRAAQELGTLLSELKPGLTGNATVAAVASALSKRDPQAALQWLSGLPEEQRSSQAYVAAASAWAKNDPPTALPWCRENGIDAGGRGGAVLGAAMESRPLETLQWVQALPPGGERDRMLERVISSGGKLTFPPVTEANGAVIVGLLAQLPPDAQERAAYQLGWSSGHSGKLEAVPAWTERLTDRALRGAAVEAAVRYRYGANPAARDELLAQFSDGPERDGALAGIAAQEREKAPARAAETALEITNTATRHDVLDGLVADWIERSPAQARAWLNDAKTLPAEWRNAWLAEASARN